MSWVMVDVEADGPCPGLYSMVSLGAVVVRGARLDETFYARFAPLPGALWLPEAFAVSGHTREEHEAFPDPMLGMCRFYGWLTKMESRPQFVSDNNGFDWGFVNWYLWAFCKKNPFGHSSTNLGSLYKGLVRDTRKNFKHLRMTRHTHHPVDDARGNAEALQLMRDPPYNLGIKFD